MAAVPKNKMNVEIREGFRETMADIVENCIRGNTDSCTITVDINEKMKLEIDIRFRVKIGLQQGEVMEGDTM